MEIPNALVDEIRQGRVVLFLGAGASKGARNKVGEEPPSGKELTNLLSDRFLGGRGKDEPLSWIAELAISETDLATVQDYIAGLFLDLVAAKYHLMIPTFRWRGLVTTNFDTLIENIYSGVDKRVQNLVKFVSDKDRVDDLLRTPESLPLLKLHGCITLTHDEKVPLILTTEQYSTHREGRNRLFQTFYGWGYEYPIVFIGHGMQDSDIRITLLELSKLQEFRPRYYIVKPSFTEEEKRLWESKRISILDGTFESFMNELDSQISSGVRILFRKVRGDHPVRTRFVRNEEMSPTLENFLTNDADYLHGSLPIGNGVPTAFYKGFDLGWYPIGQNLDVRRKLMDTLLFDVILRNEEDRPTKTEFYVIKAEAGAGKTVLLRRLAWEAAAEANALCIFMYGYGHISYEAIRELYSLTQKRIFFFIDDTADHVNELEILLRNSKKEKLPLTVISAERINEWNMGCENIAPYLSEEFQIKYLSDKEIADLVRLLEKHKSLGYLDKMSQEERVKEFEKRAGRQLLVALYEATTGKPFEEILIDEYNEIRPKAAQVIYLSVCVLNRLNIPVRAGLIARIHGIGFADFKEKFLAPLEHVVQVKQNPLTKDYFYLARHPEIAAIVFDRILSSPHDRLNEYLRILAELNLAYTPDRRAYRGLVHGKTLLALFPDYKAVLEIFRVAETVGKNEPYLYQQKGIYEMSRPNGNYERAYEYLNTARTLSGKDPSIVHSLAELARIRAEKASTSLEKTGYRLESKKLAYSILSDEDSARYARHTIVKILLDELHELLEVEDVGDREIDGAIESLEDNLEKGLQKYPGDSYLLSAEADLGRLLNDKKRAFTALVKAFETNKRNSFIAIRLSKVYNSEGMGDRAVETLGAALEANPSDKGLHYQYAMLLRKKGDVPIDTLIYHFRRAFTKWDSNYEGQFWFARYAFESKDKDIQEESKIVFRKLRDTPMAHEVRISIKDMVREIGRLKLFKGTVVKKDDMHGFVERDGVRDWLFFHRNDQGSAAWSKIVEQVRVEFNIGFSFSGAKAVKLKPI